MAKTNNNSPEKPAPLDFSGQKLAGRSFRGRQDLAGADFSFADLRGVDFRGANLADASFCSAKIGKSVGQASWDFFAGIPIGSIVGFLELIALSSFFGPLLKTAPSVPWLEHMEWGLLPLLSLKVSYARLARRDDQRDFTWRLSKLLILFFGMLWGVLVIWGWTTQGIGIGFFPLIAIIFILVGTLGPMLMASILISSGIAEISGALIGFVATTAILVALILLASSTYNGAEHLKEAQIRTVLSMVKLNCAAVFGTGAIIWWMNRQSVTLETTGLDWLRRWSFRFSTSGTDFRGAVLAYANFSGTNLAHSRFTSAKLAHTVWRGAINLHLADFYRTLLEPKCVRDTLISGNGSNKSFVGLKLHGLCFSGMNLAEADFTDADLSSVSFDDADLSKAKLTRAVLLAADLSRAKLTGASIGHWNIDKHTCFGGVECAYVYLDEDGLDRQPENGEFRPGEFEKLYQEIAHTVEFLIENPAQMDALLRSLAKVRSDFGDDGVAQVQKVERKDGGFKVSVEVPPELEAELRREIRREFDARMKRLKTKHSSALVKHELRAEYLQRENDRLSAQVIEAMKRPFVIHNHPEIHAMTDNSRSIKDSTTTQANINLGDHVTQHNDTHASLQAAELASLLDQLRGVINQSDALPEPTKAHALQQVEVLEQAATKSPTEAKAAATGPIEALKMVGTLAGGIGSLVGAAAKLFGL